MRRLPLISALAVLGCHSSSSTEKKAGPTPAPAPAAASGTAAAAAPATSAPPKADAHPMPAAAVAELKTYGAPHGTPIYIPPLKKEPEHWIAFVGGDAAMSAWVVSAAGKRPVARIDEWPTGVAVKGAYLETSNHGFLGNPDESYAWILVDSRAGHGQPAGLHGVVRVEIEGGDYANTISNVEGALPTFAKITTADALAKTLDALSADQNGALKRMDDTLNETLAGQLGKADAALAAMIPAGGAGVYTGWQKLFVEPKGRATTVDELRPFVADREWRCDFTGCTSGDALVTLGVDGDKLVIRDVIIPPAAPPSAQDARKVIAPSPSTGATEKTLHERGIVDAKVLAEAATARGTIGVYTSANQSGTIFRDGDVVLTGDANVDETTTADQVRFADVDGDGVPELAVAVKLEDGSTKFVFDSVTQYHDVYAGLAAIGATDLDDAVARAVAPTKPVTVADACKVLKGLTSSGKLKKMHARVLAFEEPSEPEIGYEEITKGAVKNLRESVGECDLDCDASRPACTRYVNGPDTEFFLFRWNGDKLELAIATVYMGA